jgi:hypothetical protein
LFKQYALHSLINDLLKKIKIRTKSAVDHKLTEGIIFTMQFPTATVKKRIRGQPETGEELRARITREETFKIAWDIV